MTELERSVFAEPVFLAPGSDIGLLVVVQFAVHLLAPGLLVTIEHTPVGDAGSGSRGPVPASRVRKEIEDTRERA